MSETAPQPLWLDDIEVGLQYRTAEHLLEADEIIEFARRYDPQPFHLSEEGAVDTLFGTLRGERLAHRGDHDAPRRHERDPDRHRHHRRQHRARLADTDPPRGRSPCRPRRGLGDTGRARSPTAGSWVSPTTPSISTTRCDSTRWPTCSRSGDRCASRGRPSAERTGGVTDVVTDVARVIGHRRLDEMVDDLRPRTTCKPQTGRTSRRRARRFRPAAGFHSVVPCGCRRF